MAGIYRLPEIIVEHVEEVNNYFSPSSVASYCVNKDHIYLLFFCRGSQEFWSCQTAFLLYGLDVILTQKKIAEQFHQDFLIA